MDKEKSDNKYLKFLGSRNKPSKSNIPVKKGSGFNKKHVFWGLFITVVSFTLSIAILFLSTSIFKVISYQLAALVVLAIIVIGILFDIVGIAVTAADETPFHSMASKKIKGAKQSIMLLRNASKVSSFCNDVIGDICGVVSGAAGTAIVYSVFAGNHHISLLEVLAGALIAALTVGGKGFTKNIGINNANYIVYKVGRFIALFSANKVTNNKDRVKS
ncbi:MAG: Mg2+ and Co2+ transporter CorB [Clostridiaceae bacterium]|nr:Mg2+ and Co2+ transporter CorB [Clostridiaceae bacterium]